MSQSRYRESLDPNSNIPVQVGTLTSWRYGTDVYVSNARPWYDPTGVSGKRMWDELHPPLRKRPNMWRFSATGVHPTPENSDFGGPLRILEQRTPWHQVSGYCHVEDGDPGFKVIYDGGFVPTWFGNHPDPPPWGLVDPNSDYGKATEFGAEAWDRFKPNARAVDLTSVIYELKDLPEQLKTSSGGFRDLYHSSMESVGIGIRSRAGGRILKDLAMNPNYLANHFLNHVFGWAPFIGDMVNTYKAVVDTKKRYLQQKQENGRFVHRRGTVRKIAETSEELYSDHYAYVYPDIAGLTRWDTAPDGNTTRGYSRFIHETNEKTWFSAEFKYWIPELSLADFSRYQYVMSLIHYYGIRVNPAVIWKLTPWSWLADWGLNVSQFYKSISESMDDNLVARYAYVMRRIEKSTEHYATVFLIDGRETTMSWIQKMDSKHRAKASPFGFNLHSSDLSAKQLAILGTLGITRVF